MWITKEPQPPAETEQLCTINVFVVLRFGGTVLPEKGQSGNEVIQKVE